MSQFVRLVLHTSPSGRLTWLKCLRATAEHYGWLAAYDEVPEYMPRPDGTLRRYRTCPGRTDAHKGGLSMRISESPDRDGWPAGHTHRFRISRTTPNMLIAELAFLTQRPWAWMTDKEGHRIERDEWLRRAEVAAGYAGRNR